MCTLSLIFNIAVCIVIFYFNDTATTEINTYVQTLSLHDALPICWLWQRYVGPNTTLAASAEMRELNPGRPAGGGSSGCRRRYSSPPWPPWRGSGPADRKSTRLNSSH